MKFPKCAIPLFVPKSERITLIGTGFLARRRGEVGLVTAANVPIGIRPFATGGWVGWPHEVLAVTDLAGPPQPVQLFGEARGVRAPTFSYSLRNEATGYLHDMIGFFRSPNEPAIAALQEVFDVIDLETEPPPLTKGTVLTAVGYPDRGGATTWPYTSPRRSSGLFEHVGDDGLIEATFAPADGLHGGPVMTDRGAFVGMVAGSNGGSARIHSHQDLLSL